LILGGKVMKVELVFPFDIFAAREDIDAFLNMLPQKSESVFKGKFQYDIEFKFKVDFHWRADETIGLITEYREKLSLDYVDAYVVFSAEVDDGLYIRKCIEQGEWMQKWSEEQRSAYAQRTILGITKSNIDHFILCSYIANPFIAELDNGIGFIDGEFYQDIKTINFGIHNLSEFCRDIRMPVLRGYPIADVWSWYRKLPGLMSDVTDSRLGRALVYLSKLFGTYESKQKFSSAVWAISGIEALLADSQGGIERQIKERLSALLPSIYSRDIEKHIAEMYGFRSRVLHGQVDIAASINYYTMQINDETSEKETNAEVFATAVLIFLIQTLFERKETRFRFKTILLD
jgi:hypothetical protein